MKFKHLKLVTYTIWRVFVIFSLINLLIGCNSTNNSNKDYTKLVNPMIGTDWHGHTFPGATNPFGMVQLSPDTRVGTWDGCSGYHYSDHSILGFSHTHFSGTGGGGGGDIMFMPTVGEVQLDTGSITNTLSGYRSKFSHKEELAEPGYYRVKLEDDDVLVELTSTLRVGLHKYSFPDTDEANVILDLSHGISDEVDSLYLDIVSNTEISGFRESHGSLAGPHKIFFVAQFSQPFKKFGISVNGGELQEEKTAGAKDMQAFFRFDINDKEPVMIKVALSRVSIEGAHKNMETELPGWDFDAVKNEAREFWNKESGRIEVKGGTTEQTRTFYTAMYHSFIHPDIDMDVDRQFLGGDNFHLYNQRGQFYRNLYDPTMGFMRPKASDYQWLDSFDPMMASNHVTEGNAYQYSLFVPQDMEGLVDLMGGDDQFERWLDVFFMTETDTTKMYLADVTGRIGQYAHGNEPSHHMHIYTVMSVRHGKPNKESDRSWTPYIQISRMELAAMKMQDKCLPGIY